MNQTNNRIREEIKKEECPFCDNKIPMNRCPAGLFEWHLSGHGDKPKKQNIREEWYEYLRSIIKNRDYIPEDAIDGAGDWWLSKINELLKSQEHKLREELVEKIKEKRDYWKNKPWNPEWNLEIEDKVEVLEDLLSNLSTNKENENNE